MVEQMRADGQMAFRINSSLKDDFAKQAQTEGKKPSQLVIELMTDYLKRKRENQQDDFTRIKQLLEKHEMEISQLKEQQQELVGKSSA